MRTVRFLIGFLLLPVCWGVTVATLNLLPAAASGSDALVSPPLLALAAGYGCWLLIFSLLPPPVRAYIWAHELTHALWGLLSGARVGRIHVGRTEGYVRLSRASTLTTLAPYFFPLYTMLLIGLRLLLGLFYPLDHLNLLWLFLVGLTWGFHLTFTLRSLGQRQPDIIECGWLFSHVLIYIFNVAGIGLWIIATTPATIDSYAGGLYRQTAAAYDGTRRAIVATVRQVGAGIGRVRHTADRKGVIESVQ